MAGLLVRNARCWTGVRGAPWAETALALDGRFVFVGREAELEAPSGVETLDAGGRLVLPGFIDGHVHLLHTGLALRSVDLKGVGSVAEAVRRVAERVALAPAGQWVRGAGWDQHLWPGARFPHRRDLDAVAQDRPVALTHSSGHCVWVNSAALRAAGVTRATASPAGGALDVDEDGEPCGILRDMAARLVYDAMPRLAQEERLAALREAVAHAQRLGVTTVHAMDVGRGELDALHALHKERALGLRVRAYLSARRLDEWLSELRSGDGDDLLRVGGVKFFVDGALGPLTAWLFEPYEGTADAGLALLPPDELERQARASLAGGLAPAIHAIGDRANRAALDVLGRLAGVAPELPRRIEHAQLLTEQDLPRFAALGVTASVQPVHATQDMAKVDRCWGRRGRYAYAFASLLAGGAALAFGSDSPVETMDPLAGLHAAVTRRDAEGRPRHGWYPQERLSLEAALNAYGAGGAGGTREDGRLGRIAPGYLADCVVLSRNVFELEDAMDILDARVEATVSAGEIVWRPPA